MENLKKIIWLSPKSHPGKNVMVAWSEYVRELGWELFDENNINGAKAIFCGSESQLERAVDLKARTKLPLICYCWGFPYFRLSSRTDWVKFYSEKIELLRRTCEVLIVPSDLGKLQLADWGLNGLILEPGVDDKLIKSIEPIKQNKQIISVGRLVVHKRHDRLISLVGKYHLDLEVVLVGSGEEEQNLIGLANQLNVKIRIETNLNDIEKIKEIKKSICLVSASEYEGFGMPIIEALTAGTPALIFDTPFFRWYFKDGGTFFDSEIGLRNLISACYSDDIVQNIVKKAKEMTEYYSFSNAAKRMNQLLGGIVSSIVKEELGSKVHNAKTDDELAKVYELNYERELQLHGDDLLGNPSDDFRAGVVSRLLKKGSVLDVGCAHGAFSLKFAQDGFDVTAFDISTRMLGLVKEATKKRNIKISFVDSIKDIITQFDNVWIGEVLEHVIDCKNFLTTCRNALKNDGLLIGTVPFKKEYDSPLHLREFDEESLRKLLQSSNFQVKILNLLFNPITHSNHILFLCTKTNE